METGAVEGRWKGGRRTKRKRQRSRYLSVPLRMRCPGGQCKRTREADNCNGSGDGYADKPYASSSGLNLYDVFVGG